MSTYISFWRKKKTQKKAFPDTGANLQVLAFAIHRCKHRLPALCTPSIKLKNARTPKFMFLNSNDYQLLII